MQAPVGAEGELAVGAGAAGADPVVGIGGAVARCGLWAGGVGAGGGGPMGLPAFVGQLRGEPQAGRLRPLAWIGGH